MSLYGNLSKDTIRGAINESFESLNEAAKITGDKKVGKYTYKLTNLKFDGKAICIESKDEDIALPTIDEAYKAMNKSKSDIKDSVYNDFFNYITACINNGDKDMGERFRKLKSASGLKSIIKLEQDPVYDYIKSQNVGIFRLTFDANPYIDKFHVYTKMVEYDFNTKKLNYKHYEYDG